MKRSTWNKEKLSDAERAYRYQRRSERYRGKYLAAVKGLYSIGETHGMDKPMGQDASKKEDEDRRP